MRRVVSFEVTTKSMGRLGNIVAETFSFLSMFPCLPTPGNIVAETKFASWEAKMFPDKIRNIFVAETMFPSLPTCFQLEKHFSLSMSMRNEQSDKMAEVFEAIESTSDTNNNCFRNNVS